MRELDFYVKSGLSFFPLPYKQKSDPKFKWGEYQTRRPTEAEIKGWFPNGGKSNIAIVCGEVSNNLVVLDCDSQSKFEELAKIICTQKEIADILDFTLCSRTGKGVHIWLYVNDLPPSCKYPKLDIKSNGGYIVAPPSVHPSGTEYQFINDIPIRRIETLTEIGIDTNQHVERKEKADNWISRALLGVGEGERNETAIRLAGHFKNSQPQDITEKLLLEWNQKNHPPMDERELLATIKSAYRFPPLPPKNPYPPPPLPSNGDNSPETAVADTKRNKSVTESVTKRNKSVTEALQNAQGEGLENPASDDIASQRNKSVTESVTRSVTESVTLPTSLAHEIEEWVKQSSGWFSYGELDRELDIITPADKANRRNVIKRLKDADLLEQHRRDNKLYRYKSVTARVIDFKRVGNRAPLDLRYPFGLESYYKTYPGNIVVIAGAPDAGKTAFLLNFIYQNQNAYQIYYQSSEMGEEELAARLRLFPSMELEEWKFTAEESVSNFADLLRPGCVNIIDYLEFPSGEFYMVADYLRAIHDNLKDGAIALVAIQKKRNADLGRGAEFSLEKPRLYLSMDAGRLKIQKCKNWQNSELNPNGLVTNFKLVNGCEFIVTNPWHKEDEC